MNKFKVTFPNGKTKTFSSKRAKPFTHVVIGTNAKGEWEICSKRSSLESAITAMEFEQERGIWWENHRVIAVEIQA